MRILPLPRRWVGGTKRYGSGTVPQFRRGLSGKYLENSGIKRITTHCCGTFRLPKPCLPRRIMTRSGFINLERPMLWASKDNQN